MAETTQPNQAPTEKQAKPLETPLSTEEAKTKAESVTINVVMKLLAGTTENTETPMFRPDGSIDPDGEKIHMPLLKKALPGEDARKVLWLLSNGQKLPMNIVEEMEKNSTQQEGEPKLTESELGRRAFDALFTTYPDLTKDVDLTYSHITPEDARAQLETTISKTESQKQTATVETKTPDKPNPIAPIPETQTRSNEHILSPEERSKINALLSEIARDAHILEQNQQLIIATIGHEAGANPIGDELRLATLQSLRTSRFENPAGLPRGLKKFLPSKQNTAYERMNEAKTLISDMPGMTKQGSSQITIDTSPTALLFEKHGFDRAIADESLRTGKTIRELTSRHIGDESKLGTELRQLYGESTSTLLVNPKSPQAMEGIARTLRHEEDSAAQKPVSPQEINAIYNALNKQPNTDTVSHFLQSNIGYFGLFFQFIVSEFSTSDPSTRRVGGGH